MSIFHFITCVLFIISKCSAEEDKLNIYTNILSYPCTTLTDINGPIGCTGSRNGNSAPLWPLETQSDLDDWLNGDYDTKILVVTPSLFNKANMHKLVKKGSVEGIVVLPGKRNYPFSPVSQFPNKQFGLDPESPHVWNPYGDDFAYDSFDIPIFSLAQTVTQEQSDAGWYAYEEVLRAALENKAKGGSYPQWGAKLDAWMYSSGNAETCLRRGQCEPLGGKSTYSSFTPLDASKETILAISGADSNSFFHDLAVGADSEMSGLIALLAAANALSGVDRSNWTKQVIFSFFAGESWGYIGSSRFVHDIKSFTCNQEDGDTCSDPYASSLQFQNIKMDKISGIVELKQVGRPTEFTAASGKPRFFVHRSKSSVTPVWQALQTAQTDMNITLQDADKTNAPAFPPSSVMSFLKEKNTLDAVVIAEHDREYTNEFYHSEYDNYDNVDASSICIVGTLAAKALHTLASNTTLPSNFTVDCALVEILLDCLTRNMNCEWGQKYLSDSSFPDQPSQYTSVYKQSYLLSATQKFVHDVMADTTASSRGSSCETLSDCEDNFMCIRNTCLKSATYYHEAYSLAFQHNSDGSWDIIDSSYSTWTESVWGAVQVRTFKMDSPVTDVVVFIFGLLNVIASVTAVWILQKYLTKRFKSI